VTKLLVTHGAHIGFVLVGVVAFLWTAYRKPVGDAAHVDPRPADPRPPAPRASLPVARRALIALGPLLGALATGAIVYGMNLGGSSVPGAVIWAHAGVSLLALLLVAYKVSAVRRAHIRRGLSLKRLSVLASVALGALSVPLLVTGIQLLFAPRGSSFAAYAHLVASAWWSGLLVWHLRRYVGPALRAALGGPVERPVEVPASDLLSGTR
jgi:hypothetical protein